MQQVSAFASSAVMQKLPCTSLALETSTAMLLGMVDMICLRTYSLCDGDKKRRAICQLKDTLDLALAIGGISYQAGSVVVM